MMKKLFILSVLTASIAVMTCCSAEDPFEEYSSNNSWNSGIQTNGGNSSTTGELASFNVVLNAEGDEPAECADAYFPDEEDALENNEFTTVVSIDLSAPVSKQHVVLRHAVSPCDLVAVVEKRRRTVH